MLVEVLIGRPSGGLGSSRRRGGVRAAFASASGAGTSRQVRHSPCTAACEMSEAKPERLVEPRHELVGHGERRLADPAAPAADDVQVGGVLGEVVAGGTVVDVGVPDEAELLQGVERAVDGRRRHRAGTVGRDGIHDVVGGRVPQPPDGGQDPLALRREALAPSPQPLAQIAHPTNVCRTRERGQNAPPTLTA